MVAINGQSYRMKDRLQVLQAPVESASSSA